MHSHTHLRIYQSPRPENNADRKDALSAARYAQEDAQLWTQGNAESVGVVNTQDDTAGETILHQQYLSSVPPLIFKAVAFWPTELPLVLEHWLMPLIATLVPLDVQFDVQSTT